MAQCRVDLILDPGNITGIQALTSEGEEAGLMQCYLYGSDVSNAH